MSFKIRDEAFEFEPIDLVGDSLALRGRGRVGFGGDVYLDFYSRPPVTNNPFKKSDCVQHDVTCHRSGPRNNIESSDDTRYTQNR